MAKTVIEIECACGRKYRSKLRKSKPAKPCPKCGKKEAKLA